MQSIYFAGSASPQLTHTLAQKHGGRVGKSTLSHFGNSEIKVRIEEPVKGQSCTVVQSLVNPTNDRVMELAFYLDALKREGAGEVQVIIPYLGYARQNIQHLPGECVSAHVIISLIESFAVQAVTTIDIHDEATAGIFTVPFKNSSALPLMARQVKKTLNPETTLVGSPDQGGIERARSFAQTFYEGYEPHELFTVEKKRNLSGIHEIVAVELYGNVEGKDVLLVDDVATSGGTIIHAAQLCRQKGARSVSAAVVHPDFAPGVVEKLQASLFAGFYTTDTIEEANKTLSGYPVFHQISIHGLL